MLDIQRQVHVLLGPHWRYALVIAAVKPLRIGWLHHAPVAGAAPQEETLLAEALHASVAGHQLHPMDVVEAVGVQVGNAVVGVREEEGHDENQQKSGGQEPEAQGKLHGGHERKGEVGRVTRAMVAAPREAAHLPGWY